MVKMELPSSKSQASSVKSIGSDLKSKIAAFQSALSGVSGIVSFKGVAASKAKEYAESNMRMIAESANDLVDGVVKSVSQLPSEYTGQVDSKSHDSEKLQQSINQLQQQQSTLNSALDAANKLSDSNSSKGSMIGNIKGLQSANSAKLKKQQELLQKLLQFDSNSPRYFDDIDSLFSAFEQAADNVKLDYNASVGSYGSFTVSPKASDVIKKSNEKADDLTSKSSILSVGKELNDSFTDNTLKAGSALIGQMGESKMDEFLKTGKCLSYVESKKLLGTSKITGSLLSIYGNISTFNNDKKKFHENGNEASMHIVAGAAISGVANLFINGLLSKTEAGPFVKGAVNVGADVINSGVFNAIYKNNWKGVRTDLNNIGDKWDKEINDTTKKIKSQEDYPGHYKANKDGDIVYETK